MRPLRPSGDTWLPIIDCRVTPLSVDGVDWLASLAWSAETDCDTTWFRLCVVWYSRHNKFSRLRWIQWKFLLTFTTNILLLIFPVFFSNYLYPFFRNEVNPHNILAHKLLLISQNSVKISEQNHTPPFSLYMRTSNILVIFPATK